MIFLLLLLSLNLNANTEVMLSVPEDSAVLGESLPDISLFNEKGESVALRSLGSGQKPFILMPMFTRCAATCPMNVMHLKEVTKDLGKNDYDVILFSFDPRDKAKDLQDFKKNLKLPEQWQLFTASAEDTHRLLESLKFNYMTQEGQFVHPNAMAVISPNHRIIKYFRDLSYSAKVLSAALVEAKQIHRFWGYLKPLILLAGAFTVAIILAVIVNYRRPSTA